MIVHGKKFVTTAALLILVFVNHAELCQPLQTANNFVSRRANISKNNSSGVVQLTVDDFSSPQALNRLFLLNIRASTASLSQEYYLDLIATTFADSYKRQQEIACSATTNENERRLKVQGAEISNEINGYGSDPQTIEAFVDFSFILKLNIDCIGCRGTGYDLFKVPPQAIRDFYEVPFPSFSLLQADLFKKPCVPAQEDTINDFVNTVMMELNIPGLDMIYSMAPLRLGGTNECNEDEASGFKTRFTLAFYGETNSTDLDNQVKIVEQTAIASYNELNVLNPSSCDPYSRVVTNATVTLYNAQQAVEGQGIDTSRRRLMNKKIGYDWYFIKLDFDGFCYGCPYDTCLANDVSSYANCGDLRRRLIEQGDEESLGDSCYCTTSNAEDEVMFGIPTNEEFQMALEERFMVLKNETNFTLVESIVYLIEVDVPDSCCGWPDHNNIPVEDGDLEGGVSDYLDGDPLLYGYPINCWDVSRVHDMSLAFYYEEDFNEPLICWDTSNATDMSEMFNNALLFNQDLSSWDTSKVTDMRRMFRSASSFNQDLTLWDTNNVDDMYLMFSRAIKFNGDISQWNTSKVTDMDSMFENALLFNQDLSFWDTGNVEDMSWMFIEALEFNGNVGQWNTGKVIFMDSMFESALSFNRDISQWDTGKVTRIDSMFESAMSFNRDISQWNITNNSDLSTMFREASSFNRDISNWDTSGVRYMYSMFEGASSFNQNISMWDTSEVSQMSRMFRDAIEFNQDISKWNISQVRDSYEMFRNASSFRQDLCPWRFMTDNLDFASTLQYGGVRDMFVDSNCPNTTVPSPGVGPWCFTC